MLNTLKKLMTVSFGVTLGFSSFATPPTASTIYACQSAQGVKEFAQAPCKLDAVALGTKSIAQSAIVAVRKPSGSPVVGALSVPTDASQGVPAMPRLAGTLEFPQKVSPS